jgi:hypothetical protein
MPQIRDFDAHAALAAAARPRLADFVPTSPAPAKPRVDPHVAGLKAQVRYLNECRGQGIAPLQEGLDRVYWRAYRAVREATEA